MSVGCHLINSRFRNDITVTVDSDKNTPLVFNPKHFKLNPNQSRIVTVTVRPDGEIRKNFDDRLYVTALFHQGGKVKTKIVSEHLIQAVVNEKLLKRKALAKAKAKAQARQRDMEIRQAREWADKQKKQVKEWTAKQKAREKAREKAPEKAPEKVKTMEQTSKGKFKFLLSGDTQKRLLNVGPRGVVTTAIGIKNPTKHKLTFVPELKLPEGWRQIAGHSVIELKPKENKTNLSNIYFI